MNAHTDSTKAIHPKLYDILEKEEQVSQELLGILDEEQAALTAMDVPALIQVARKKFSQFARIQALDKALNEIGMLHQTGGEKVRHPRMQQAYNTPLQALSLSSLVPRAAKEDAVRLERYRKSILDIRREIQTRNQMNKRFAEDTLGYLHDAISLITGADEGGPVYHAKGMIRGKAAAGPTLISREV